MVSVSATTWWVVIASARRPSVPGREGVHAAQGLKVGVDTSPSGTRMSRWPMSPDTWIQPLDTSAEECAESTTSSPLSIW